jgi:hypothetical protein
MPADVLYRIPQVVPDDESRYFLFSFYWRKSEYCYQMREECFRSPPTLTLILPRPIDGLPEKAGRRIHRLGVPLGTADRDQQNRLSSEKDFPKSRYPNIAGKDGFCGRRYSRVVNTVHAQEQIRPISAHDQAAGDL